MLDNVSASPDQSMAAPPAAPGCGTQIVFAFASLLTIATVVIGQWRGWFSVQLALIDDTAVQWYHWPLNAIVSAIIIAAATVPAMLWSRFPRYRAMYRSWLVALGCALLLSFARAFHHNATQYAALTQSVIALALWALIKGATVKHSSPSYGRSIALALVPLVALPWLAMGAFGSVLDILLAVLQGLSFGLLAGVIVERLVVAPLVATTQGAGWDTALGGYAGGIAIVVLLCGFGFDGNQLLMLFALPPLAYAATALGRQALVGGRTARGAIALLIGGATVMVLALIDPAELLLILGDVELPTFALATAGAASAVAWAVGVVLWVLRSRDLQRASASFRWAMVAIFWSTSAVVYGATGTPGLYGDRLFVVMREQADLTAISVTAPRPERLDATYRLLAEQADRTQADLRRQLDRWGIGYTPYYLVNGLEVDGGPLVRAYLERRADVDRVLLSPRLRPLPEPLATEHGDSQQPPAAEWNIKMIGADRVWKELGVTGKGIVVGQSDSGVQGDHPSLRDGYRGRGGHDAGNWLDPWNNTTGPTDVGGHGTHTLGTAVGRNGIGVAPGAEWFACVNLARNIGNPAHYLDCLQFMLAPYRQGADPLHGGDPSRAAHVINNSWGCPELEGCDPGVLAPAVRALRSAGIFVVASAGNSGPRCGSVSDPPAIYDDAFSVGATDASGDVTSFSSRGPVTVDGSDRPKPDILAPGDEVVSSLPGSSYGPESGTSMAGPHIAGVVALMWSAQPRLVGDIETTERILRETARPYEGAPVTCIDANGQQVSPPVRYGMVDAYAAVKAALGR